MHVGKIPVLLGGQAVGTMGWHLTALFPWPKEHQGLLLDKTIDDKLNQSLPLILTGCVAQLWVALAEPSGE